MEYVQHEVEKVIDIPKIVTIEYSDFDKNYDFYDGSHDFWEFVYVDKGKMIAYADGKQIPLQTSEIIFHKPNEIHQVRGNGETNFSLFVCSFVCNSQIMKYFDNQKVTVSDITKSIIAEIIDETRRAYYKPYFFEMKPKEVAPIGTQQLVRIHIEELLIKLLQENFFKNNKEFSDSNLIVYDQIVSKVVDYIGEHIYEKITVEDICHHVNYGKTYISTLFLKTTGYTLIEYITKFRIRLAKSLIRNTEKSCSEISEKLLFNSPQYFYKIFKKETGMTPNEYKHSVISDVPSCKWNE